MRPDAHLLRNIVTFEVASRTRSFTRAGEEMGMSRVAVSRQIADLEQGVGQTLFVRGHREVSLTAAGQAFAHMVNPALAQIAEALARQRANAGASRLSVTMTSAFATYCLMPRLAEFSAQHPEVEVNLVVSDRYLDLEAEGIDIAVRYTPTPPEGRIWREVFRESIFPVFSPRYQARTRLMAPRDLLDENLLCLSGPYRVEARWTHWFQQQGLDPPEARRGVRVNTYINMLQAAIEGQGIALAGHPLVDRHLQEGSLLRLPSVAPLSRDRYYVACRSTAPSALLFTEWLEQLFASADSLTE